MHNKKSWKTNIKPNGFKLIKFFYSVPLNLPGTIGTILLIKKDIFEHNHNIKITISCKKLIAKSNTSLISPLRKRAADLKIYDYIDWRKIVWTDISWFTQRWLTSQCQIIVIQLSEIFYLQFGCAMVNFWPLIKRQPHSANVKGTLMQIWKSLYVFVFI